MNTACTLLQARRPARIERSTVPVFMRLAEAWLAREQGRVHTLGERQYLLVDNVLHPIHIGVRPQ